MAASGREPRNRRRARFKPFRSFTVPDRGRSAVPSTEAVLYDLLLTKGASTAQSDLCCCHIELRTRRVIGGDEGVFLAALSQGPPDLSVELSIGRTRQVRHVLEGEVIMRRHVKAVELTVPNPEAMWNMDPQAIETVTRTYRAWFNQASRMHDETMRFAHERFTKELDAAMQLVGCTNPTEAFAVQVEFANNMAADYIAEGQKMVNLMSEIARGISMSPESDRAHR